MTLPKYLTTVTPLSKIVALIILAVFPFVGFYLGMEYQKSITPPPATFEKSDNCQTQENISQEPTSLQTSQDISSPVVVYNPPGLFSAGEKEVLNERIVQPQLDYYHDKGISMLSIMIDKKGIAYSYFAIYQNGNYDNSSINVRAGIIDYWVPGCLGPCEFSQSFKDKYPEIVRLSNP